MSLASRVVFGTPESHRTPFLALAVTEGDLPKGFAALDKAAGGALSRLMESRDFRGRHDDVTILYPPGPAERILVVGMGKAKEADVTRLRTAAAVAARRATKAGVAEGAFCPDPALLEQVGPLLAGQAIAEGLAQGAWAYHALKKPPEEKRVDLERFAVVVPKGQKKVEAGVERGAAIGEGHAFARGLQMLPGNMCTPAFLADTAKDLARRHGFKITVLDRDAMKKEGMGALLAVAQGSANEPRFIVLEYKGAKGAPVVLVGKGVTFDTGGISIKPAQNMEEMKFDMSGAAAVLGTFEALGRLKPKVHVIGLIPSAENMLSSTAYKPGDVVRAHSGKTIEVVNTDAEGRLLLADALSWASRYKPACVLDAATLTGAVVIALGHSAIGVLGTDQGVVDQVLAAGERAGERAWQLPLWDDYRELIKSDIADIKNSGGRPAGTITAGWFLREFVGDMPWAHLDIAGTAYSDRERNGMVKGPTASGVRLFTEFVLARQA